MSSGIYEIRNIIDKHFYVGSAANIEKRWYFHSNMLNKNKHFNIHLQRAWNKYGKSNFIFRIIEKCDISSLIEREQYYIDTLRPEYNISQIAGKIEMNLEIRQKIGKANAGRGHPHNEESKDKIRKALQGKKKSEEHIRKMILAQTGHPGRPISEKSKQKISASKKGKKRENFSDEWRAKLKEHLDRVRGLADHTMSEENKKKLSNFHKGKKRPPRSEEWLKRQSESHKGKSPWNKGKKQKQSP